MKKILYARFVLLGLVLAQAVVYAGPCYVMSGTTPCPNQGGNVACNQIFPFPNMACPGGPWTLAQLAAMQANALFACGGGTATHQIPNGTLDGQASGSMNQGNYSYVCNSMRNCTKTVTFLPVPVVYACMPNPLQPCINILVNTAGGPACPSASGG